MDDAEEFFIERCAIMQFDGGLRAYEAELVALQRTRTYCALKDKPEPALGYFYALRMTTVEWDEEAGRAEIVTDPEHRRLYGLS